MRIQMKRLIAVGLLSNIFCPNAHSQAIEAISKEMVEYELSGGRWQGGESHCLEKNHFKLIQALHQSLGEPELVYPKYILPKGSEVTAVSSKVTGIDLIKVDFSYQLTVSGKLVKIEDSLTYILNIGARRKRLGAASIYTEPKKFAMREECLDADPSNHSSH